MKSGDPSSKIISRLKSLGYLWIILPTAILTGRAERGIMGEQTARPLVGPPPAPSGATPDYGALSAYIRMLDCLEAVNGI